MDTYRLAEEGRPADRRRAAATAREVARLAGVSQMTVSRVLNQPEKVNEATADRVREAIRALNYRPNVMAQGLAGGKSLLIGLLYHNPSADYLSEVMFGALRACRERGHHLLVEDYLFGRDWSDEAAVADAIVGSGVQGLVVCPPVGEDPRAARTLRRVGVPFVRISTDAAAGSEPSEEGGGGLSIGIDDRAAARAMTEHLLALGHEEVAFIAGPSDHASSKQRLAGFRLAMKEAGRPVARGRVARGAYTYRSGMEAALSILEAGARPTAIFASNDDMAAGAVAAAMQKGLRVPDDLSVAGFDDVSLATVVWPALTTVRQPIAQMVERAVACLEDEAFGEAPARPARLPFSIVERDSVRPPARK